MSSDSGGGASAYISFDVDHIKEFVFAGQRPLDITGASELVKQIDSQDSGHESGNLEEWLNDFRPFKVVYAVGGSGIVRIENGDRAEALCRHLEQTFRKHTLTGSCSAVSLPIPKSPLEGEAFREALRLLGILLQHRKAEKAGMEPAEAWTMGNISRCQACGVLPSMPEPDELPGIAEPEWVCQSCRNKRTTGRAIRKLAPRRRDLALSLSDISNSYIACLYADVNNAGKLLLACNTEEEVRCFSGHLFDAVQSAVTRINGKFQSPVIGGDDLLLLLPAHGCAHVTLDLWKYIDERLTRVPEELRDTDVGARLKNVSLSIGLAVVEHRLPINFIFEMAQSLLKNAKASSYETGSSMIDYMLLKGGSPMSENIRALRDRCLVERLPHGAIFPPSTGAMPVEVREKRLTRRPYLRAQLDELVASLSRVTERKAALRSILDLFQTASPMEIYIHTQYQKSRNYLPGNMDNLLHRVEKRNDDMVVTTGVGDLLELYEMDSLKEEQ